LTRVEIVCRFLCVVMASVALSCDLSASEMRVLVETIVGEPDEVVPPPVLGTEESSGQPTNLFVKAEDGRGSQPRQTTDTNYEVSVTHAFSQLLTKPLAARTGTNLKSDPVSGSFGLSGYESSIEITRNIGQRDFYVGMALSRGSFKGSVAIDQGLDTSKVSTLDSEVELDVMSYGITLGKETRGGSVDTETGSAFVGVTRHDYDLDVSDSVRAYVAGFAFPSNDVERSSGTFVSADLGVRHEMAVGNDLRLGVAQTYRTPIAGASLRYRQFATQLSLHRAFGAGSRESSRQVWTSPGSRCGAIELVGGDGFSSISGTETSSSSERSIDVDSELGWSTSQAGLRLRFGAQDEACHEIGLMGSRRLIDYRVKGLDVDSSIRVPMRGSEVRYSYQPMLADARDSQTYLSIGSGLWVGSGTSTSSSSFNFQNVSSTATDDLELVLFDLGVGIGFRQFFSDNNYLFYELSTSRYDGRPLGKDVYGWENNLRTGVGFEY
jgi:hypothetical protein